jgi:hypothetical protein
MYSSILLNAVNLTVLGGMAIVCDSPNTRLRVAAASLLDFPPIRHQYLLSTLGSRFERDTCQSVTMRWRKAQAVMSQKWEDSRQVVDES